MLSQNLEEITIRLILANQIAKYHFPPFKAAADAGVRTFMNSFNELNGIPATGTLIYKGSIKTGLEF
jgi:beta-glucosidase-like glycosyl hydrolase